MKHTRGMFVDCIEQDQPDGTYRFAKNIVDSNLQNVIENEDGFKQFSTIIPSGHTVIGVIPIEDDFVLFTTDDATTHNIILVTAIGQTLTVESTYTNTEFNFSSSYPIEGEYRREANNDRVIYWIDEVNPPRFLNIDNTASVSDLEDTAVFPRVSDAGLTTASVTDGGSLPTGALIPITRYRNSDGTTTNWFVQHKVFYLTEDSKGESFQNYDGAIGGINSGKTVNFTLTNCDTTFDFIQIGYIQSTNGVLTAVQVLERVVSSSIVISITGTESQLPITLDEVLTSRANYTNAKCITQLAGRLYYANLTSEALPELQTAAINTRINWSSSLLEVTTNTGNHRDVQPPTFQPGEVYAFYLGVKLKRGGWVYYHIPGRELVSTERDETTEAGMTFNRYQVKDTVSMIGAATNMGYWENENETYPAIAPYTTAGIDGDLVRHHRFPTLQYLKAYTHSGDNTVGRTKLPILSIDVSNVIIPAEIQDKVSAWSIFFAKKTPENSLVVGSDLYHASGQKDGTHYNMGGNFLQDWQTSGGLDRRDYTASYAKARGHSPDLMLNRSITPQYARFEYRLLRVDALNTNYQGFRSSGTLLAKSNDDPADSTDATAAVLDYTTSSGTATTVTPIDTIFEPNLSRIDNFRYIPENSISNDVNNLNSEGIFAYDLNTTLSSMTGTDITNNKLVTFRSYRFGTSVFMNGFDLSAVPATQISTAYMSYCNILSSVHNSFTNQELVQVSGSSEGVLVIPSVTTATFQGGDTFTSYVSYLSSTCNLWGVGGNTPDFNTATGVRVWHSYIGYTKNNINFRYEKVGDPATNYYGKTDVKQLFNPPYQLSDVSTPIARANVVFNTDPQNVVEYNIDYSLMNTFGTGVIYDVYIEENTEFPNTIIYSEAQNQELGDSSWRTFLAGDRYTMTRNRGVITNIQGFRNRELVIHTEDSIFRSRTDVNAGADAENIFFKSANLFELPPEELQPSANGYGGTQHKFACVLTKVGYFFVNDKQGKVFLYTGEALQEISTNGMRTFFRDYMGGTIGDNPFIEDGYTVGYDEQNNRLLLTRCKAGDTAWTISYNPLKQVWVSFHSYIPTIYINTATNNLYGVDADNIYLQNLTIGMVKGQFYDGTYSSFVDVIFNPEPQLDKQFIGVEWVTEAYPTPTTATTPLNDLQYTTTLTQITVSGRDSSTGRLPVTLESFGSLYNRTTRNLNRTWYFNDIRDITTAQGFRLGFYNDFEIDATKLNTNMNWYEKRKITDKFVICRLEYDNLTNMKVLLLDSKITYRHAR